MNLSYSHACERNREPILRVLRESFREVLHVLEIGSGTGQHATYFARAMPHLRWQASDRGDYLPDLKARIAAEGPENCPLPLCLDVRDAQWPSLGFDAVFTANTLHIMNWQAVIAFFAGLPAVMPAGVLCVYGPFCYSGNYSSESNRQFDQSLIARDPDSGIRDFERVNELAHDAGFRLLADHSMPANNQLLVWRRDSS